MSNNLRAEVDWTVLKCRRWAEQLREASGDSTKEEAVVMRNVAGTLECMVDNLSAALADSAMPCIQKGCGKPNGHEGRHTDGTLPGHLATADAPPSTNPGEPTDEMVEMMFETLASLAHAWETSPVSVRFHIREALRRVLVAAQPDTHQKGEV